MAASLEKTVHPPVLRVAPTRRRGTEASVGTGGKLSSFAELATRQPERELPSQELEEGALSSDSSEGGCDSKLLPKSRGSYSPWPSVPPSRWSYCPRGS